MDSLRCLPPACLLLLFGLPLSSPIAAQSHDPETGLATAAGWEEVRATCTECHSARLITQNAGSRSLWLSRIRWMQDSQGLRELSADLENRILDYLSEHYGPRTDARRAGLPPQLMPDNPYPVSQ